MSIIKTKSGVMKSYQENVFVCDLCGNLNKVITHVNPFCTTIIIPPAGWAFRSELEDNENYEIFCCPLCMRNL